MSLGQGGGLLGGDSDDELTEREDDAKTRSASPWPAGDSPQDEGLPGFEDDTTRNTDTETGELNP